MSEGDIYSCHFCGEESDEDSFCFGCKHAVCENCDVNFDMPFGSHSVDVHRQEPAF